MEFLRYCKNHFKYKIYKILLYAIIALVLLSLFGCKSVNAEVATGEQYTEFATSRYGLLNIYTNYSSVTLYGYNNKLQLQNMPDLNDFITGRKSLVRYENNSDDNYSHSAFEMIYTKPGNWVAGNTYLLTWTVNFTDTGNAQVFASSQVTNINGSTINSYKVTRSGTSVYIVINFTTNVTLDTIYVDLSNRISINWFLRLVTDVYYPQVTQSVYYSTEELEEQNDIIISQNAQTNQKLDSVNSNLEKAEETRKGIWETIKDLPNQFLNMLKSLFIPEDGYFETWFNDLKTFFEDKLGFLATPFTIFIDFINMYLNLDSSTDIIITIPDITVPNFENYKIISATTLNWSELLKSKESLNALWQLYLSFVDVFLILNFIGLCETKYNRIFGGDTSNYEYYTVEDSITYDGQTGEVTGRRQNERRTTRKKVE